MTQTGTVERRLEGGMVLLSVARQTACGHDCEKCSGCGVQAGHLEVRAVDRVGVRPGDRVEVRSDNRKLLGMAALVYLLPVAMFLVGNFLGDALARAGGGYHVAIHCAVAILMTALGVLPAVLYDRRTRKRADFQFEIVRKL